MAFKWLNDFHREMEKPEDYAEKTLAAYRLGMKARGSIAGVRIERDKNGCAGSQLLETEAVYHPDDAPYLPLPDCSKGRRCGCVYRPVMSYEDDRRPATDDRRTE